MLILHAVLVAVVADLPVAAVHPVVEVTLDVVGVVLQVVAAHHVLAVPPGAVPVLPAVVLVGVPAVLHVAAVHEMATVALRRSVTGGGSTVVVALIANGPFATIHIALNL